MNAGSAGERVGGWAPTALLCCALTAPLAAQTAPTKPTTLKYDSVNAVIAALMPAAQKQDVRNIAFSAQGTELRMDAEVRLAAVPGMEMMAALGFAKMTGIGPVSIVSPGMVGWRIRSIEVAGVPLAESIWSPPVRKATKRSDNVVPVPVGSWVKGVEVQPAGLRLY
jgi:hypothetical protein